MTAEPDFRIERALHAIAEDIELGDDDVSAARATISARADAAGPTRRPAIVAAAASVVLLTGVGGLWLATDRDGGNPSANPPAAASDPITQPSPSDRIDAVVSAAPDVETVSDPMRSIVPDESFPVRGDEPPGVADETPILDPDVYIGSTRPSPWTTWVHGNRAWHTFVTFDGEVPSGAITVGAVDTQSWLEFVEAPPIDVGDGAVARVLVGADVGRIGVLTETSLVRVTWYGTATQADAVDVARAISSGDDVAAITPPPDFVDRSLELTASSTGGANIVVQHYTTTDSTVDIAVVKMIRDSAGPPLIGIGYATVSGDSVPPWMIDTDMALRQLDDDSIVVVWTPLERGVDLEEAVAGVRMVDTADVQAIGVIPEDADVHYGESSHGRWFLATWTSWNDRPCSFFATSFAVRGESCLIEPPEASCWVTDSRVDDPGTFVLIDGDPKSVEFEMDDGEMVAAELESTAGFVMATGPELETSHDIWIDGEPTVCR